MRKHIILLTSMILVLSFQISYAQSKTRLIGYEEICLDSFGAPINYTVYWHKFSGNRGSVIAPEVQVGFVHDDYFIDASAADTTWMIRRNFSATPFADSSMNVTFYNSSDAPVVTYSYAWNFQTSSWITPPATKDTFVYNSNLLVAHSYYKYDATTSNYVFQQTDSYAYNANNQLIAEFTKNFAYSLKTEYTWSGNQMINEKAYDLVSGIWQLQDEVATTYAGQKAITQKKVGYINNVVYDQVFDSNIYNGNTLTQMYSLYAGYYTAMYPFNYRQSYTYNANGNVSEMIFEAIDSFGVWKNDRKMDFTYNKDNNPELITFYNYDKNSGTWKAASNGGITTKHYYYAFPTSVKEVSLNNQVCLYPCPAQNDIHLSTTFFGDKNCIITILDVQGRVVKTWNEMIPAGNRDITISTTNLVNGMYWLRLSSSSGVIIKEFNIVK